MVLFLGIISLLSGSSLGFLVSQFWFNIFNYIIKTQFILNKRKPYKILIENFQNYSEKDELLSLVNYILTSRIKDKQMTNFIQRKNDLFNTLVSTGFTIITGMIIGYITKKILFKIPKTQQTIVNWCIYDNLLFVFLSIVLLSIILNSIRIWREHDSMASLVITFKIKDIKKELSSRSLLNFC